MDEFNILLCGVGGQGILLAAELLGVAALNDGFNVRVSEIHGMAQRGGSVVSHVRIGDKVLAPTISKGQADVLLSFEQLETLRNLKFVSEKTLVIMNNEQLHPTRLSTDETEYPTLEEVCKTISHFTQNLIVVDAMQIAQKAGGVISQNIVLIGVMIATENVPVKTVRIMDALHALIPPTRLKMNITAFQLGHEFVRTRLKGTLPNTR